MVLFLNCHMICINWPKLGERGSTSWVDTMFLALGDPHLYSVVAARVQKDHGQDSLVWNVSYDVKSGNLATGPAREKTWTYRSWACAMMLPTLWRSLGIAHFRTVSTLVSTSNSTHN